MPVNELSDADLEALSIVGKGANRKTFFLKKSADPEALIDFPAPAPTLIKSSDGADWETAYCVVAAPGDLEDPGVGADAPDIPDRWASEDEIRKAAHRFVQNGALVNKMHESLEPYGELVESAIALGDIWINGQKIAKGSWYVGIKPTAEGRAKIDKGEFTGVSIQGTAKRTLVEKADDVPTTFALEEDLAEACRELIAKVEVATKPGTANVSASDRKKLRGLAQHYLAKPRPFTACVRDQKKHGLTPDHANKRCAVLLDAFDPKRKRHSTRKGSSSGASSIGSVSEKLLRRIGKAVGISDADIDAETAKGMPTFSQRMAQQELDEELPDAMSVLRGVIYRAFNPYPPEDGDDVDPRAVIEQSLEEFGDYLLDLYDRTAGDAKVSKSTFDVDAAIEWAGEDADRREHVEKVLAEADIDAALPWVEKHDFDAAGAVDRMVAAATGQEIAKSPEGSNESSATVGPVSDTDLQARVEKVEKALGELPDKIAEAISKGKSQAEGTETKPAGDETTVEKGAEKPDETGGDAGEKPDAAEISKKLDDVIESVAKLAEDVDALAAGESSQAGPGSEPGETLKKSEEQAYTEGILG